MRCQSEWCTRGSVWNACAQSQRLKQFRNQRAAAMASHSWERPERLHSWEARGDDDVGDFWGECSDDEPEEPDTPGQRLVGVVVEHWLSGRLSAAQACELCYWAKHAGIGEAKPFALRPGAPTGHYGRKIKSALGHAQSPDLYMVDVPGHSKHDLHRTSHSVATLPFHEHIATAIQT